MSPDDPLPITYAPQFMAALRTIFPSALHSPELAAALQAFERGGSAETLKQIWNEVPPRIRTIAMVRAFPLPVLPATLGNERVPENLLRCSAEGMQQHGYAPVELNKSTIYVATARPWASFAIKAQAKRDLSVVRNDGIGRVVLGYTSFENFSRYESDIQLRLSQSGTKDIRSDISALSEEKGELPVLDLNEESPTNPLLRPILEYAVAAGASDVHIFPDIHEATRANVLRVQIRVGMLEEYKLKVPLPGNQTSNVIKRRLIELCRENEKKAAIDGKFRMRVSKPGFPQPVEMDVRFASLENKLGAHISLRLLDQSKRLPSLEEICLYAPEAYKLIQRTMKEPSGIFLIVGPTGSGKSTTLNVVMSELKTGEWMIYTVEDPVEYDVSGIGQFDASFLLRGLEPGQSPWLLATKAMLRKDPDIMMIGEVRDAEVAGQTIAAAVTGHQVYTTLHCDSVTNINERLGTIGVRVQEFAHACIGATSQRLVRRVCRHCGERVSVSDEQHARDWLARRNLPLEWAKPLVTDDVPLREARKGRRCPVCSGRGYHGFAVAIEHFDFTDDDVQEMIASSTGGIVPSYRFAQLGEKKHWPNLAVSCLRMIYDGATDAAAVSEQVSTFKEVEKCNAAFGNGEHRWDWQVRKL